MDNLSISNSESVLQADAAQAAPDDQFAGTVDPPARVRPRALRSPWMSSPWTYLVLLGALWIGYWALGPRVADWLALRFQATLDRTLGNLIGDPAQFVLFRLREALTLLTWFCGLVWLVVGARAALKNSRVPPTLRGLALACVCFAALNVFVLAAERTALFWGTLTHSKGKLANHQFKCRLRTENPASVNAVVVGSSQANHQIDERLLNEAWGRETWGPQVRVWEVGYAGSTAFDLLLMQSQYEELPPNLTITYVSEYNFYRDLDIGRFQPFMTLTGLADYYRSGGGTREAYAGLLNGLVSMASPLYRVRSAVVDRFLDPTVLAQMREAGNREAQSSSSSKEYQEMLARHAAKYRLSATSDFYKTAFADFARRSVAHGGSLVICVGQLNPDLTPHMDPALRADMRAFLQSVAAESPRVTLLDETTLPSGSPADYDDLTHVNLAAKQAYSAALADALRPVVEKLANSR